MSKELKWSEYDFSQIPFDDIEHFGTRSMLDRDTFTVSWLLGRFCNYRCSYCWPYARSDKKDHRPLAATIGTINEIKRQARERGFILASPEESRRFIQAILILFSILMMMLAIAIFIPFT